LRARRTKLSLWRSLGSSAYGLVAFAAVCFCYTVVKATLFLHAKPFDASIVAFEVAVVRTPPYWAIAAWSATRPHFVAFCDWIYFRLFQHMLLTLVLLVARRRTSERIEYLAALCFGLRVAGVRYFLWHNTQQVKDHTATALFPWGYVACMPSLHVAHEVVMTFYTRRPLPAFVMSLAFTAATLVAVVVLGWHYATDWFAGGALGAFAIVLARALRGFLWPAALLPPAEPDLSSPALRDAS
jgi:hypothetical protein